MIGKEKKGTKTEYVRDVHGLGATRNKGMERENLKFTAKDVHFGQKKGDTAHSTRSAADDEALYNKDETAHQRRAHQAL